MHINTNTLLALMRKRRRLTKEDLLDISGYALSLDRVESGKENPRFDTLTDLLTALKIPADLFFCACPSHVPPSVYKLRSALQRMLDDGRENNRPYPAAPALLQQLEACPAFERGVSLQLLLSMKAQLFWQLDKPTEAILPLINQGMAVSFPEFNPDTFHGEVLAFQEPELLWVLAMTMARAGNRTGALRLLQNIWAGLDKLPVDMREKEAKLSPVLLTLADMQRQAGNLQGAADTCRHGRTISMTHGEGRYAPNFWLTEGQCRHAMGDAKAAKAFLEKAYFGFALLHKAPQLAQTLHTAKALGLAFDTHGVQNLTLTRPLLTGDIQGPFSHCRNIGELIGALRKHEKLTQEDLCRGICSPSKLSRIESGDIAKTNPKSLEALMERLGRSEALYLDALLTAREFENHRLEGEIQDALRLQKYEAAAQKLSLLEAKPDYKTGINRQFILTAQALLLKADPNRRHTRLALLYQALGITCPHYAEADIDVTRFTHGETTLVNQLALFYGENGDAARALNIWERLRVGINRHCVDEAEKNHSYGTVMLDYAHALWLARRPEDALEMVNDCEAFALKRQDLIALGALARLRAVALSDMGYEAESRPYFAAHTKISVNDE